MYYIVLRKKVYAPRVAPERRRVRWDDAATPSAPAPPSSDLDGPLVW